jgi:hypothetical protein
MVSDIRNGQTTMTRRDWVAAYCNALQELWDAAEEWAESPASRDNTPEEDRVVAALRALRAFKSE